MPLTARMVFEHPELAELAAVIDAKGGADGTTVAADTYHEPMAASGLSADELAALTAGWGQPEDGASGRQERSDPGSDSYGRHRGRDGAEPAAGGPVLADRVDRFARTAPTRT